MSYNIDNIHYRDIYGKLLFQTPMIFKRLHGVGEKMVEKGIWYVVKRVCVVDNIQHVNIVETPSTAPVGVPERPQDCCHDCIYSTEDDCNPNNYVCLCTGLFDDRPNEHYLHILHANHNCIQDRTSSPKSQENK